MFACFVGEFRDLDIAVVDDTSAVDARISILTLLLTPVDVGSKLYVIDLGSWSVNNTQYK